jgi:hypothetical protein
MAAITVGGFDVAAMQLTYSWGLSPASATVTIPGAAAGIALHVGDAVAITLGGSVFNGIINQNPTTASWGTMTELQLVDNRIKLMWDDVYCTFNNAEVREDNPATPGLDRQKRYWHIFPDDWDAQQKTWTQSPLSAVAVINGIYESETVETVWNFTFHADQDKPVYSIGDNNGQKFGTLLQEVSEQQGLVFTLVGENTLLWVRKGEGDLVAIPDNVTDWKDGDALSNNDTKVRIVGDRNRYQDLPIDLTPDWKSVYEEFWSEPAWLAEVAAQFELDADDVASQGELVAKARSVTVREYVAKKGDDYIDAGTWGEVGRMEIPVWVYLQDIVWKAYRVPTTYTINGIDLESLEINDGLLAAVTYSIDDGEMIYKSPSEYYPDAKAFIIAKGQPMELLDPRTQGAITPEQLSASADSWSAQNKFTLDVKNYCVIFEHAVFLPGTDEHALFLFPNHDSLEEGDPLYNIAVPNADVVVTAAPVRASMVFSAERYSKRFGSGVRKGAKYISGLNYHALMDGGVFQSEVVYADNRSVDTKAAECASTVTAQVAVYRSGGYTRHGSVGTALTSTIDRVSVNLSFADALTEQVEYTKERSQSNFENERDLDRKAKARDLFPGQKNNAKEVEQLHLIAKLSRELKRNSPNAYSTVSEVMQRPVGAHRCSISIRNVTTTHAGQVVWLASGSGDDAKFDTFGGIVVAEGATTHAACVTYGTVPVRVKGPFHPGDSVGCDATEVDCTAKRGTGWRSVGQVLYEYAGTDTILVPVQIGSGGGAAGARVSLQTYKSAYTGDSTAPDDQERRVKVRPGFVRDVQPGNNDQEFVCGDEDGTYYMILHGETEGGRTVSASLELSESLSNLTNPVGHDDEPPEVWSRVIATIEVKDGVIADNSQITNCYTGSIDVIPQVVAVSCDTYTQEYFIGNMATDPLVGIVETDPTGP